MVRIFRHFVPVSVILLAFFEILAIFLALHFYLSDRPIHDAQIYDLVRSPAFRLAMVAGAVMILSGLYHTDVFIDYRVMAIQISITFVLLIPVAIIFTYFFRHGHGAAVSFLELGEKAVFIWLLCIVLTRTAFLMLADLKALKRHVLVLGTGQKAARIAELAAGGSNPHFVPVAYARCGLDPAMVPAVEIDPYDAAPSVITEIARRFRATEIVVATDDRRGLPVSKLLQCRTAGIHVIDYLDFIERETKTVDIMALQPSWLIFSDGFRSSGLLAKASKRSFDVMLSLALLLFTLPLMLLTCLLIMLEGPGPIFYRQTRVGRGGRPFVLVKFRSMRADAEKDGAPQWARRGDTRVTKVGRLIRKLRIDELPQLWNVLRGDMSFVGPRPERPAFVDNFAKQIPFYAERHCVKPGITGWAQINYPYGASLEDARNKLSYDLYYVKNHGLFLDLIIVLQTVRVILWADGAR